MHVLSTPPAFILSQDQTLQLNYNMQLFVTTAQLTKTQLIHIHYLVFKDQMTAAVYSADPANKKAIFYATEWLFKYTLFCIFVNLFL